MTEGQDLMDRSPSYTRQISIEKLIQDHSLKSVLLNAGDSFGEFRSGNSSIQVCDLIGKFEREFISVFFGEQLIEKGVSGSKHFMLGYIL